MAQGTKRTKSKTPTKSRKVPDFSARLKALRMERNWSLREVEKRSGAALSRQTVLRAEQGGAELSTVLRLVSLYGLPAAEREALLSSFHETLLKAAKVHARA